MAKIDLNAKRAARREAGAEPVEVAVGEDTFVLPAEIPLAMVEIFASLADRPEGYEPGPADMTVISNAMRALFGDEQWARFSPQASLEDMLDVMTDLLSVYGTSLGESSALVTP